MADQPGDGRSGFGKVHGEVNVLNNDLDALLARVTEHLEGYLKPEAQVGINPGDVTDSQVRHMQSVHSDFVEDTLNIVGSARLKIGLIHRLIDRFDG